MVNPGFTAVRPDGKKTQFIKIVLENKSYFFSLNPEYITLINKEAVLINRGLIRLYPQIPWRYCCSLPQKPTTVGSLGSLPALFQVLATACGHGWPGHRATWLIFLPPFGCEGSCLRKTQFYFISPTVALDSVKLRLGALISCLTCGNGLNTQPPVSLRMLTLISQRWRNLRPSWTQQTAEIYALKPGLNLRDKSSWQYHPWWWTET